MKTKTRRQLMKRKGIGYHIDLPPVVLIMQEPYNKEVWLWIDDCKNKYYLIGTIYVPLEEKPYFEPINAFVRTYLPDRARMVISEYLSGYKSEE